MLRYNANRFCFLHTQACKFRDEYQTFVDAGAAVFGISSDSPEANSQFASNRRLPFPLLTDEAGALRKVSMQQRNSSCSRDDS
jgi:peroxiredoxin